MYAYMFENKSVNSDDTCRGSKIQLLKQLDSAYNLLLAWSLKFL